MNRFARGAARRLRRVLPPKMRPAILMYHRIATECFDPWGLAVEEERFAAQLKWLASNREVLSLADFAERHRQRRLSPAAIALTFDDGYACAMKAAAHLERLDLPATIFVAPELIERGREFWWDELAAIIFETDHPVLHLNGDVVHVPEPSPRDSIWVSGAPPTTARQRMFHGLWAKLRTRVPPDLDSAMSELRGQSPSSGPRESHRPLTAGEIRTFDARAVSFGSHALSHPSLPSLSEEEKVREIGDSRSRCAELSGINPTSFAYPYGDLDQESSRLVREAGFDCACSTQGEFVSRRSEAFALPRLQVGNWDVPRFADMLAGR